MATFKKCFATILSVALLTSTFPAEGRPASQPQGSGQAQQPQSSAPSDQEIQQMVAPIALYPDALVAQILAAATYPTQVVEADRWLQQNKNLPPDQLAAAANKQSWDPSVKALTQFPSVLDNMSQNLTWTSNLGDVYYNNQQGVMNAVQVMRKEVQQAGNLKTTPQQTVSTQGQTIVIQPASPTVVYVPTYPPTIYGTPVASPPGYSGWDVAAAAMVSFGVGMMVGAAIRGPSYGWGWGAWGCNWHGGTVVYNRNVYVSRSNTFVNRSNYYNRNVNVNNINRNNINTNNINRNNINTNNVNRNNLNQNNANRNNFNQNNVNRNNANQFDANRGNSAANRGYGQANAASRGERSGGFGGYNQGGASRAESARGRQSFGGGGGGRRR